MKLSTKGRYAVTAMVDLALGQNRGPMTLADISRTQGISLSYLEQLFARLRGHRLVSGVRGPGGGYRLARPAAQITVADIVVAIDESGHGRGESEAGGGEQCVTHELWRDLSLQIHDFLDGITLAELARQPEIRAVVENE